MPRTTASCQYVTPRGRGDSVGVPSEPSCLRRAMMSGARPTAERNWIVTPRGPAHLLLHPVRDSVGIDSLATLILSRYLYWSYT